MKNTIELIKTIRILGFSHMLRANRAKKIADKIIPGFFITRVINALLNVGFFDEFFNEDYVDIDSFAKERNLDKRLLHLLCDYLCISRIFKKYGLKYRLTAKGQIIREMLCGIFDIIYGFEDIFHSLESLLRKEKILGQDVIKRMEFEAKGTGAAAKLLTFPIMIDIINKRGYKKIFDIGCGTAIFLIELCKSNPDISGYGIDASHEALIYGERQLIKNNFNHRISLLKWNILNEDKEVFNKLGNIDIITASFVLHELFFDDRERLISLLRRLKETFKNTPFMICENIEQTHEQLCKNPGLYSELQLAHGLACEKQMTRGDWKEVFKKSGFKNIEERHLAFAKISIFIIS